ncbi:MAG: response regulator [Gammaproteobacteria bacterium]|nr:MAG: response regulator [Gammaproteobacteria bacterium]
MFITKKNKVNISCLLFLIIVVAVGSYSNTVKAMTFDEGLRKEVLGKHIQYLADQNGEMTIGDILKPENQKRFVQSEFDLPNMGFTKTAYWIKLEYTYKPKLILENKNLLLEVFYPLIDDIRFYSKDNSGDYDQVNMGDNKPFEFRPILHTNFLYPLEAKPETTEVIYIRIKTSGSLRISMVLWDQMAFLESDQAFQMLFGICIGAVMVMVLYNLFLYLSINDKTYIHYVMYSLSFVILQLSLEGVSFHYLWPGNPWMANYAIILWGGIFGFFLVSFARVLLKTKENFQKYDKFLIFMQTLSACLAISVFIVPYEITIRFFSIFVVLTSFTTFVTGILGIMKGMRTAKIYTLACMCFLLGILIYVLMARGLLPYNYFTGHSGLFGAIAEVVFFSFALADKINAERAEKDYAQSQSLEHLKHYQDVFENAAEGLFRFSLEGRFLSVNRALVDILRFDSSDELIGNRYDPDKLFYYKDEDRINYNRIMAENDRVNSYEMQFLRKDSTVGWASCSARLIRDKNGIPRYYEGSVVDITDRKEREKVLREKERAEASANAKSSFLANMSHEIRTPMNAIIGFSELAIKSCVDSGKVKKYLHKILISSQTLLGIINDILDFSKIEAGKLKLEKAEFSIDTVMDNVAELFSAKILEKDLEFVINVSPEVPPNVIGDSLRLSQILINLITNAIKFTDKGVVRLSVKVSEASISDDQLILDFEVADTGIGIEEEGLNKLFQSFSQADESTTRKFGGTGLGLAICKHLVELMGGRIAVKSEVNKGSCFSFSINVGKGQSGKRNIRSENLTNRSVLVVDDNVYSTQVLADMLTESEMNVDQAYSAEKAEKLLKCNKYDFVIVDWMMPGKDGIEFINEIKNWESPPATILMTGHGSDEIQKAAYNTGIDSFLYKPVRWPQLLSALSLAIGGGESEETEFSVVSTNYTPELLTGKHILLVEDNLLNQELICDLLEGYPDLDIAGNGREAVEITKVKRFDLILMDIQMPEMNGYEATDNIRKKFSKNELPIVAMTANAMKGVREKCLHHRMNDFITKPIDVNCFFSTVFSLLDIDPNRDGRYLKKQTEGIIQLPEKLSGIDIDDALSALAGNKKIYLKMVSAFLDDYSDAAAQVEQQYDIDPVSARRLVHSIKGIAGSLGAGELMVAAAELEKYIKENSNEANIEEFKQLLETFSSGLNIVLKSLESITDVTKMETDDPVRTLSQTEKREYLKKLKQSLEDNNLESREIIDILLKNCSEEESEILDEAMRATLNFDFSRARDLISQLY